MSHLNPRESEFSLVHASLSDPKLDCSLFAGFLLIHYHDSFHCSDYLSDAIYVFSKFDLGSPGHGVKFVSFVCLSLCCFIIFLMKGCILITCIYDFELMGS